MVVTRSSGGTSATLPLRVDQTKTRRMTDQLPLLLERVLTQSSDLLILLIAPRRLVWSEKRDLTAVPCSALCFFGHGAQEKSEITGVIGVTDRNKSAC